MATETNTSDGYQVDFFDIVDRETSLGGARVNRSWNCFWKEDILPTAIKIREIYSEGCYSEHEKQVLMVAHTWLRQTGHIDLLLNKEPYQADKNIPLEVILNEDTLNFFTIQDIFKKKPVRDDFEVFVAFKPGTDAWQRDIVRQTSNYFKHRMYFKVDPTSENRQEVSYKDKEYEDRLTQFYGIDREILKRYKKLDTITWLLLMQYSLKLLKRERAKLAVCYSFR